MPYTPGQYSGGSSSTGYTPGMYSSGPQTETIDPKDFNSAIANGKTMPDGFPGLVAKAMQYMGPLALGQSAAHLKTIHDNTSPSSFADLPASEKVRTGMDVLSMGALPIAATSIPFGSLAKSAALAGAGMGAYNETVAPTINKSIDLSLGKDHPYLAEGAKILPNLLAGLAGPGLAKGMGGPKAVPIGQEPQALVNNIRDNFNPNMPTDLPSDLGAEANLTQTMERAQRPLGQAIGDIHSKISDSVGSDPRISQVMQDTLGNSMSKGKIPLSSDGLFQPELAPDTGTAKLINDLRNKASQAPNFEIAQNLQEQLGNNIKKAFKTNDISNTKAPLLLDAQKNLKTSLDSFVPQEFQDELGAANKPFQQNRNLQELVGDSFKTGNFDPGKFSRAWKTQLSDSDKARIFTPQQIKSIDDMVTTPESSTLGKIGSLGVKAVTKPVQYLVTKGAEKVFPGSGLTKMLQEKAPTQRFYQPNSGNGPMLAYPNFNANQDNTIDLRSALAAAAAQRVRTQGN